MSKVELGCGCRLFPDGRTLNCEAHGVEGIERMNRTDKKARESGPGAVDARLAELIGALRAIAASHPPEQVIHLNMPAKAWGELAESIASLLPSTETPR